MKEDNKKSSISRKDFVKVGTAAIASTLLGIGCKPEMDEASAPNVITTKKYKWKMVTTWPPNFPVLGEGCVKFAQWVEQMSNGQLQIKVYGGGELIPALECFDAVSGGAAEMASGVSYYWAGKAAATQFFAAVPFGMNAQQFNAWLYFGGGQELWNDLYADFGLVPMAGGNTGVQMGGWYNRAIDTIEDFQGLKMRMPGLGGKVLSKVGGTAVLSAGSEIYTNMERGVIDATEWIGPYHDYLMGFSDISQYYYAPGWHEPGANLENFFNKREFDSLPDHLKAILEAASVKLNMWTLSEFEAKNNQYLNKIKEEGKVEIRAFSKDVIEGLRIKASEVMNELCDSDKRSKQIYQSYSKFQEQIGGWSNYSEKLYYGLLSK